MPFALCAAAVWVLFLAGCRKGESPASAPSASPESYMRDTAFRQDLKERRLARNALSAQREKIVAEMTAMIEAKKKALGTADEAKLKAALEKDPEWNSLHARCVDLNTAIRENRRDAMSAVRRRLTPEGAAKKEISK